MHVLFNKAMRSTIQWNIYRWHIHGIQCGDFTYISATKVGGKKDTTAAEFVLTWMVTVFMICGHTTSSAGQRKHTVNTVYVSRW